MVVQALWEVFIDADVCITFVLPMLEENRPYWPMDSTSKKGQEGPRVGIEHGGEELGRDFSSNEVDFWETDIFTWVKSFRCVGVAKDSN